MIPDCDLAKVGSAGNAAGTGARIALLNMGSRGTHRDVVRRSRRWKPPSSPNSRNISWKRWQFRTLNGDLRASAPGGVATAAEGAGRPHRSARRAAPARGCAAGPRASPSRSTASAGGRSPRPARGARSGRSLPRDETPRGNCTRDAPRRWGSTCGSISRGAPRRRQGELTGDLACCCDSGFGLIEVADARRVASRNASCG